MKVSACICVYNETTLLKACLKQFPEWVDEIVVLVSKYPWRGAGSDRAHETVEILKMVKDKRVRWYTVDCKNEHDQRNIGLGMLFNSDWVCILDADEYLTTEGWEELRDGMREWGTCDVIVANMRTYWKTHEFRWEPGDTHRPTIAVRPLKTSFFDKREVTAQLNRQIRAEMHHFSWVRTDHEVFQKVQNYMHASDFDGMDWYGKIWKAWKPEFSNQMENIRPYGHEKTKAIYDPAPKEIIALFEG